MLLLPGPLGVVSFDVEHRVTMGNQYATTFNLYPSSLPSLVPSLLVSSVDGSRRLPTISRRSSSPSRGPRTSPDRSPFSQSVMPDRSTSPPHLARTGPQGGRNPSVLCICSPQPQLSFHSPTTRAVSGILICIMRDGGNRRVPRLESYCTPSESAGFPQKLKYRPTQFRVLANQLCEQPSAAPKQQHVVDLVYTRLEFTRTKYRNPRRQSGYQIRGIVYVVIIDQILS